MLVLNIVSKLISPLSENASYLNGIVEIQYILSRFSIPTFWITKMNVGKSSWWGYRSFTGPFIPTVSNFSVPSAIRGIRRFSDEIQKSLPSWKLYSSQGEDN